VNTGSIFPTPEIFLINLTKKNPGRKKVLCYFTPYVIGISDFGLIWNLVLGIWDLLRLGVRSWARPKKKFTVHGSQFPVPQENGVRGRRRIGVPGVIPAKAGIQKRLKTLDSVSRFACTE
jgi:hypothetical protein